MTLFTYCREVNRTQQPTSTPTTPKQKQVWIGNHIHELNAVITKTTVQLQRKISLPGSLHLQFTQKVMPGLDNFKQTLCLASVVSLWGLIDGHLTPLWIRIL